MAETNNKVVTTENLRTFKAQMESVVDQKVQEAANADLTYATEQDIIDLFTDASAGQA